VVHRRLDDYDPRRAKLTTWLFGIAARVATAFRRRHRRTLQLTDEPIPPLVVAPADPEQTRRLQAVQTALGTLAPSLCATLLLFEVDQMSCAEIAELSGVPLGTVYSRLQVSSHVVAAGVVDRAREPAHGVRVERDGRSPVGRHRGA
jgi:RNA polymerase sigma-70 factor (ECF subfamily)